MSRIGICYTACHLATQTVAPNIPGFQGVKCCIQYLDIHPHKPISYPYYSYGGSNVIRLTWSRNQVEYYKTQIFLERHQDADNSIIINLRRSVSCILHTLLGVSVLWKVHVQPSISSEYTNKEIICMYKTVKKTNAISRYM